MGRRRKHRGRAAPTTESRAGPGRSRRYVPEGWYSAGCAPGLYSNFSGCDDYSACGARAAETLRADRNAGNSRRLCGVAHPGGLSLPGCGSAHGGLPWRGPASRRTLRLQSVRRHDIVQSGSPGGRSTDSPCVNGTRRMHQAMICCSFWAWCACALVVSGQEDQPKPASAGEATPVQVMEMKDGEAKVIMRSGAGRAGRAGSRTTGVATFAGRPTAGCSAAGCRRVPAFAGQAWRTGERGRPAGQRQTSRQAIGAAESGRVQGSSRQRRRGPVSVSRSVLARRARVVRRNLPA